MSLSHLLLLVFGLVFGQDPYTAASAAPLQNQANRHRTSNPTGNIKHPLPPPSTFLPLESNERQKRMVKAARLRIFPAGALAKTKDHHSRKSTPRRHSSPGQPPKSAAPVQHCCPKGSSFYPILKWHGPSPPHCSGGASLPLSSPTGARPQGR